MTDLIQKQEIVLKNLQSLEEKWFQFLHGNEQLKKMVLLDPDGDDPKKLESVPLDVQLWYKKYYALFTMVEALKHMNGTVSDELYSRAIDVGNDFWLEIKDYSPENLSIFK